MKANLIFSKTFIIAHSSTDGYEKKNGKTIAWKSPKHEMETDHSFLKLPTQYIPIQMATGENFALACENFASRALTAPIWNFLLFALSLWPHSMHVSL